MCEGELYNTFVFRISSNPVFFISTGKQHMLISNDILMRMIIYLIRTQISQRTSQSTMSVFLLALPETMA